MKNASPLPLEEQLSAFVDGELSHDAVAQLLADVTLQDNLRDDWHAYHVVGDVLRNEALAPRGTDTAFWSRVEQRLTQESARPEPMPEMVLVPRPMAPANQRWAWLVGAALSVVALTVSVGIWQRTDVAGAQLAASTPTVVIATAVPESADVMIRDSHLDALMQAHQQLGGHSAWQMPSGFLRNATYEGPSR
ncbi:MAG: sigma-E factor negative regulatory protein [Rhodoferax sp.]|nr:sigma-E factor negative regulatory protein [Rhodoferax sp.]